MENKVKPAEFLIQSVATLCISFLACQTGYVNAWPSYTLANFLSNDTMLSRPMSSLEVSLLGSLPNIGGLLACPFCGYAFNIFGRKYATMFFGIPYVISWMIISITRNVILVLVAVTLAGIGIAGQNVSLIFISEISHDSIRGGTTACSMFGYIVGILTSYILAGHLTYINVVYTHLTLSVLAILLLAWLPESPVFLVMVGKQEKAAKSIAFYKRLKVDSKEVDAEISKIKLQLDPKLEKKLQGVNDLEEAKDFVVKNDNALKSNESSWKFLMKSESSKRALMTVLITMTLTIMMGCIVLQVYAEPLFREAVPSLPADQCAIYIALDFLVASMACVLVIDKYGRKFLLVVTSAGAGVCTLLLATQLQYHWAPHWFTVVLICLYGFIYTLGCAVIPFVLTAEVFLPEVRSLCNSITMAFVWIVNFITLVIFNPLVENFGLGPVFYLFSAVCFTGTIYSMFCVPETKGLSTDAIQLLFLKVQAKNKK